MIATKLVKIGTRVKLRDPVGLWSRLTFQGRNPRIADATGVEMQRGALDEVGTIATVVPRMNMTRVLVTFPSAPGGLYLDTLELRTTQEEFGV